MNDTVIVYRSRWEKDADEFWSQNPEFIMYGFFGFFTIVFCVWVFSKITNKRR